MAVHRFTIFADYFQFIVQDEDSKDDFGALWNDDAVAMMLRLAIPPFPWERSEMWMCLLSFMLSKRLPKFDWKSSTTQWKAHLHHQVEKSP